MIPRSEWSAQWSLKYAQKCSEIWVKNPSTVSYDYTSLLHGLDDAFSKIFILEASPIKDASLHQKIRKVEKGKVEIKL